MLYYISLYLSGREALVKDSRIQFGTGPGGWDSWDSWDGWDGWDSWDQQIDIQLEVQYG